MQKHTKKNQNSRKKISLSLGIFIIIALCIFLLIDKTQSPSPSVSKNRESAVHTDIETDTIKRLTTLGNSGTQWGMSPFGSGKPLTEGEEKKRLFQKPNTEWKSRTINGITYVFGEGNPAEVAKKREDLRDFEYYVNPETEIALKKLLEDDNLTFVMQKCGDIIDWNNEQVKSDWEKFPDNLDMETMLIIDPETGRKEVNQIYINVIEPLFSFLQSPITDPNYPLRLCLGDDIGRMGSIFRNMHEFNISYVVHQ